MARFRGLSPRKIVACAKNFATERSLYAMCRRVGLRDLSSKTSRLRYQERACRRTGSTLWNEWDGPVLRGQSLLDAHKPLQALAALEPTRAFDGKDTDGVYLRGLADLELRQLSEAEAEFRKILDHPGIDPTSFQRPLARLQLARTLAQEGRKPAAAEAYNAFLTSWAHADSGQPLLLAARKELGALEHGN